MSDHEQTFRQLLGEGWHMVGDPTRFLYAAQSFASARATQDWVQGWSEILRSTPYFAEPNDPERLERTLDDPAGAIEVFEAEGESLTVFVLAERSDLLSMAPEMIPGWLSRSKTTIIASVGLYAMAAHGAQLATLREWQRLDRLVRDAIDSIADPLRAEPALWWNVIATLRIIFQVRNKDPADELFATLDWAYNAAAQSLTPRLESFLDRFSPDTPYPFHCVLVHMLTPELDPPTMDRLLRLVFGRIETLRRERFLNLPSLAETYIDLYVSNLLAAAVLCDAANQTAKDRGWLRHQLLRATLPERDWDHNHDVVQRARWGLWLLAIGSIAALRTPPDSDSTVVRTLVQTGVHYFWTWHRRVLGSADLGPRTLEFFVRALARHAHVANERNGLEALVLAVGTPAELEFVRPLMGVLPEDARVRCDAYSERLVQWWNGID